MKIIPFITVAHGQVSRRILERLGVSTVVPRAHRPPVRVLGLEREEHAALARAMKTSHQRLRSWGFGKEGCMAY